VVSFKWLPASLVVVSVAAVAKERAVPVSQSVAAQLNGRSVVVTRHEKPNFNAMTPGTAMFAMVGAAAANSAGNKIVEENGIADPADVLAGSLVPAVVRHYGLQWDPSVVPVVDTKKAKEIAAAQAQVDYVLDVRSERWGYSYHGKLNTFWVGYRAEARLIDAKTGAVVSNMTCDSDTRKHAVRPTRDELLENQAQLLKDVTAHLGWVCAQLFAKEQFALPPEATPATPEAYADPLTAYAAAHPDRLAVEDAEKPERSAPR
jgi:hypothetical protein